MTARILAIDIGTSSTKGLPVDDRRHIQATHHVGYPLLSPQPDYAEQDPSQILAAVREVIETVAPRGVGPLQEVRIGGGMFEWEFCRQLLADVIGRRVAMSDSRESSALGGARLGFQALGVDHGWSHETTFSHTPDSDAHAVYRRLLGRRDDLARPVR
jgi:sugar (pentulose or hexulose) kinase